MTTLVSANVETSTSCAMLGGSASAVLNGDENDAVSQTLTLAMVPQAWNWNESGPVYPASGV